MPSRKNEVSRSNKKIFSNDDNPRSKGTTTVKRDEFNEKTERKVNTRKK